MRELFEVQDLRPAPRVTPSPVLWAMFAVVIGGACLLQMSTPQSSMPSKASASAPTLLVGAAAAVPATTPTPR